MELCRITGWYVKVGDRVRTGQPMCEVDTGKASFDIEAPADGIVLALFFADDAEAPLLAPIAVIGDEYEEFEHFRPDRIHTGNRDHTPQQLKKAHPVKKSRAAEETAPARNSSSRIAVSPRARLLAQKNNVPLSEVKGSGPHGAIVAEDVQNWIAAHGVSRNGPNREERGDSG